MKISDGYIVPVKGDYLKRFGNEEILKKYLNDFDENKTYWVFQNNLPENKQKMFDLFENISAEVTLNNDPATKNEYKFDINYGRDINTSVSGREKSVNEVLKNMNSMHFNPSDWDRVKGFFKRSNDDIVYNANLFYASIPSVKLSSEKVINTGDFLFKIGISDYNNTFTMSSTSSSLGRAVKLKNKENSNNAFEYPITDKGVQDAITNAVQYLAYALDNKEKEDARKKETEENDKKSETFRNKMLRLINIVNGEFFDLMSTKLNEIEKEEKGSTISIFKRDFDFSSISNDDLEPQNIKDLQIKNSYGVRSENLAHPNKVSIALADVMKTMNDEFFAGSKFKCEFVNDFGKNARYEDPITPYDEYIYYKIDIEKYIEEYDDFFNNPETMESNFDKSVDPSKLPGVTVISPENPDKLSDEEYVKAYEKLNYEYEDALIKKQVTKFDRWKVPYEKVHYVNKGEGSSKTIYSNKYYYKLNTNDVDILNQYVYVRMRRKDKYRRFRTTIINGDIQTSWILGALSDKALGKIAIHNDFQDENKVDLDTMYVDDISSSPESYIVKNSLSDEDLIKTTIGAWLESKPWLEDEPECYYNKDLDVYFISFTYNPGIVLDDVEEYELMMKDDLKGLDIFDYDIFYDDELDKEYAYVTIKVVKDDLIEEDYE